MKKLLDKGYLKLQPQLIKDTLGHVIQVRRDRVFSDKNGKKPIKVVPRTVTKTTYTHRIVRK